MSACLPLPVDLGSESVIRLTACASSVWLLACLVSIPVMACQLLSPPQKQYKYRRIKRLRALRPANVQIPLHSTVEFCSIKKSKGLKQKKCVWQVVGQMQQQMGHADPRTYIGPGKLQELRAAVAEAGADTVIFDDELSPRVARALEKALGEQIRLCDRTALILDIFSQRAATKEGHLQVGLWLMWWSREAGMKLG